MSFVGLLCLTTVEWNRSPDRTENELDSLPPGQSRYRTSSSSYRSATTGSMSSSLFDISGISSSQSQMQDSRMAKSDPGISTRRGRPSCDKFGYVTRSADGTDATKYTFSSLGSSIDKSSEGYDVF